MEYEIWEDGLVRPVSASWISALAGAEAPLIYRCADCSRAGLEVYHVYAGYDADTLLTTLAALAPLQEG